MCCVVQGCSNTSNHKPCEQERAGQVGEICLRCTGQISPHKEGSWSARIIWKSNVSKEASTWKDLNANSCQALFQQYGKIIIRAAFSTKSSKRHQRIIFCWKSVSEWVITSMRTRGKPYFQSVWHNPICCCEITGIIWNWFSVMADENIVILEHENCMLAVFNLKFFNIYEYFRPSWAIL